MYNEEENLNKLIKYIGIGILVPSVTVFSCFLLASLLFVLFTVFGVTDSDATFFSIAIALVVTLGGIIGAMAWWDSYES